MVSLKIELQLSEYPISISYNEAKELYAGLKEIFESEEAFILEKTVNPNDSNMKILKADAVVDTKNEDNSDSKISEEKQINTPFDEITCQKNINFKTFTQEEMDEQLNKSAELFKEQLRSINERSKKLEEASNRNKASI